MLFFICFANANIWNFVAATSTVLLNVLKSALEPRVSETLNFFLPFDEVFLLVLIKKFPKKSRLVIHIKSFYGTNAGVADSKSLLFVLSFLCVPVAMMYSITSSRARYIEVNHFTNYRRFVWLMRHHYGYGVTKDSDDNGAHTSTRSFLVHY